MLDQSPSLQWRSSQIQMMEAIECATDDLVRRQMARLAEQALGVLARHGFVCDLEPAVDIGDSAALIGLADTASAYIAAQGGDDEPPLELELAGDILVALVGLAFAREYPAGSKEDQRARIVVAAVYLGHAELNLVAAQMGLYERTASHEIEELRRKAYAAEGGRARAHQAELSYARAIRDFTEARRKNPKLTVSGWIKRNAANYSDSAGMPCKADAMRKHFHNKKVGKPNGSSQPE